MRDKRSTDQRCLDIDDGERVNQTASLIGRVVLTVLNEIDLKGWLGPDSIIKDLAIIISLYLEWSSDLPEFGLDWDDFSWRPQLVQYANKAGIDLVTAGIFGTQDEVNKLEAEEFGSVGEKFGKLKGAAKSDRWKWKGSVSTPLRVLSASLTFSFSDDERCVSRRRGVQHLEDVAPGARRSCF